jgi:hypothetical protein
MLYGQLSVGPLLGIMLFWLQILFEHFPEEHWERLSLIKKIGQNEFSSDIRH